MISVDSLNPKVQKAEYAVRGPIVVLAQELEKQGKEIAYFNIGNPLRFDQKPLTYVREIISLLHNPNLLENEEGLLKLGIKSDSIKRAKEIMKLNPLGMGPYSQSAGMPFIRESIAKFIEKRDNIPADPKNIFLTDGASKGADLVLNSVIQDNVGVMTPIPQYPLYSADITLFGGKMIPYYLDEENNWGLGKKMLEDAYEKAKQDNIDVRVIVVINPNNPTGSVLGKENIKMVLEFAGKNGLYIIADEVYQENIYDPVDKFHSFAKIAHESNIKIPIFSIHSTSKGYIGECGYRGGYLELRNLPDDVLQVMLKVRSIGLCPNTSGQIATYLMLNPPNLGDPSYDQFVTERDNILKTLAKKAKIIAEKLDSIEGISCPTPKGAMYLFPKIEFPDRDYGGKLADYAFAEYLVRETGIVTVPGSGFGQIPGTWHLRITFLPEIEKIEPLMEKFEAAYKKFVKL
jgi:aspartate/methionine/tyrosine aminotransferase